jgi:dienelactone hydrolase
MINARLVSIAFAAVIALAAAGVAHASSSAELRCNELLTGLRDGKFDQATAHFDATMAAGLPAAKLEQVWNSITSSYGRVTGWSLIDHGQIGGTEVFQYRISFEHGPALQATIAVNSEADEVAGLFFKPLAIAAAAPATSPPYAIAKSFYSEDIAVGSLKLPGRLTIPTVGRGPYPAAVLIGGSGPNDMNETHGPNHIFKDIAEGLSSRGVVVLRYDKRTDHPVLLKDVHHLTVKQEYIDDAAAAVHLLRHRSDVDPKRIFLVGHSEGAMLLPDIARAAGGVAGMIMLAPPGRRFLDMVIAQMRYLGRPPRDVASVEKLRDEIAAGKLPPGKIVMVGGMFGTPVIYITDFDQRDEFAVARQLHLPILILHGGRDYQVTDADIGLWRTHLKGVPDVTIREFPSLNHLFIAGTGKPGPKDYAKPGHVAAPVIGAIATFIEQPAAASASK